MDPSYNNSFGSFGNTPDGTPAGGVGGTGVNGGASGVPMGGGMPVGAGSPMPVSSGSGDVVIGGGVQQSGKPKKGIIIGLIVAAVVLIGGGLLAVVLTSGGGSGGKSSSSSDSIEAAFNKYANYLISGEAKDDEVNSSAFNEEIKLDELYRDKEYVEKASGLYNSFAEVEGDNESVSYQNVSDIKSYWDFLLGTINNTPIGMSDLLKTFVNSGRNEASSVVSKHYGENLGDSSPLDAWRQLDIEEARLMIDLWDIYKGQGCINKEEVDASCVAQIPESTTQDQTSRLTEINEEKNSLFIAALFNIKTQAQEITTSMESSNE